MKVHISVKTSTKTWNKDFSKLKTSGDLRRRINSCSQQMLRNKVVTKLNLFKDYLSKNMNKHLVAACKTKAR